MDLKYDFSGWATRNDLVCADGRTIRKDAFKHCDGMSVPIVWNHQHDDVNNILGHAILENRKDGVYAYCFLNETESGKKAKEIVQHGDVHMLSIYANGLKQMSNGRGKDVVHGDIREVSLVVGAANPGAFIDFVDLAHGEGAEQEIIIGSGEAVSLYHSDDKPPLVTPKSEPKEDPKPETKPKDDPKPEDKPKDDETVQDVVDSMTDKQRTVMYALIAATAEELGASKKGDDDDDPDDKSDKTKGGDNTMKHNVFEKEETQDTILSHAVQGEILGLAKQSNVGSFQTALAIYAQEAAANGDETLQHGIDNIESLFPDYKDLRSGAPELLTRDQGWVDAVMKKVRKTPISRIRTRQMDARNERARGQGYQKGKMKKPAGNMNMISRTTDPQTVYCIDSLHRDDIVDITDFDVVEYQYGVMKQNLNEEVALAIMVGDGRDADDEMKISEDHIRSIWNDNDLYTIHYDVDIAAARAELQGSRTDMNFGENFIYAEAIITAALYSREKYKGSGTPDLYCTPHLVNVMLLARDANGRRIYDSRNDLAAALNVGEIYTAEQFEGLVREDDAGAKHKLLGLFVNLSDYTVGSTKGGEISRFDQFDIQFNQQRLLIETRLSGALNRLYAAIALEEPVKDAGTP